MKCPHCNMEWMDRPGVTDAMKNCPFCGKSLTPAPKKPESLEDCLRQIFQQFGEDPFRGGKPLIGFHSDLFPERQRDRRLLTLLMLAEGNAFLLDALKKPEAEQSIAISRLAMKMENEWMIRMDAIQEICSAFWLATGGSQKALKPLQATPAKAAPSTAPTPPPKAPEPPKKAAPPKSTPAPMPAPSGSAARKAPAGAVCRSGDYQIVGGVVKKYTGSDSVIALPQGVTAIGDNAFEDTKIAEIFLPEGVRTIGANAFNGCFSLKKVSLPDSLQRIGESAFQTCPALQEITIPGGVSEVSDYLFFGCDSLHSITLREGVRAIRRRSFWRLKSLKTLTVPDSLSKIASGTYDNAFEGCSSFQLIASDKWKSAHPDLLKCIPASGVSSPAPQTHSRGIPAGAVCRTSDYALVHGELIGYTGTDSVIAVPQGVQEIRKEVFKNASFSEVYLPEGLINISPYAFQGCHNLKKISFPGSLVTIGESAFQSCSALQEIEIPGSVFEIGPYAFYACEKLQSVTLCQGVRKIGKRSFWKCGSLKKLVIPDSLMAIEPGAFESCPHIQVVASEKWKKAHPELLKQLP